MHNIANWIEHSVHSSKSQWLATIFRVDGVVVNGHSTLQTPWSQSATQSIELIKTALSWTITELRRKHPKNLRFVAYLGGEPKNGIFPHIHALIELPYGMEEEELISHLQILWAKKLKKKFKQFVQSDVLGKPLENCRLYSYYSARFEGDTFFSGDEKVIINNSFYL